MITKADAREILNAFGSCSSLYETTSENEVISEVEQAGSPRAYIEQQITVEDVLSDRMAATAREQEESGEDQYKGQHLKVVADEVEFIKLIKDRCKALMARKGW